MGVSHELGTATLRLSLGKWTTMDDLDRAAVKIAEAVEASLNTQAAIALAVPATEMTPTSQGTAVLAPLPVQSTPHAAPAVATAPLYLDDTELYSCSAELLASLRGTAEGLVVISQGSQSADSGVLQSWGPTVAPYTHALVVSRSVAHPQVREGNGCTGAVASVNDLSQLSPVGWRSTFRPGYHCGAHCEWAATGVRVWTCQARDGDRCPPWRYPPLWVLAGIPCRCQ